jgi:hypothetical protein
MFMGSVGQKFRQGIARLTHLWISKALAIFSEVGRWEKFHSLTCLVTDAGCWLRRLKQFGL